MTYTSRDAFECEIYDNVADQSWLHLIGTGASVRALKYH